MGVSSRPPSISASSGRYYCGGGLPPLALTRSGHSPPTTPPSSCLWPLLSSSTSLLAASSNHRARRDKVRRIICITRHADNIVGHLQFKWIIASPRLYLQVIPPLRNDSTSGRGKKVYFSHNVDGYPESEGCREANLLAQRKERIKLPDHANELGTDYSISEFLNDPSGVEAILNTKALQSIEPLGSLTYRCTLQKIQFMSLEVIPVIDLQVTYTNNGCKIEMLSCKFEGSEILKQQNHRFSAFMRNYITWEENISEPCLDFDVFLRVTLQVYTKPFTLLPISAVETPGTLIVQGLVDKLVPFLSEQLLQDYKRWVADRS